MAGLALAVDILARDRASGTLKKVGGEAEKTGKKFGGIKAGMAGLAGGALGGAVGNAIGNAFRDGVEGMKAAQEVSAQTSAVLKSMGNGAGRTQDQIEGMADKIEKMSGLEAENVQAGQNMLLTFDNIKGQNFDRATMAMADMSARMGGDAVGAATMLGKALQDPAKGMSALTRVGVSFTADQQKQIKAMQASGDSAGAQAVMLKALEAQFGGSAKAAGQTLGGQMKILQARLGDVTEALIVKLLPAVTIGVEWLGKIIDFVQRNQKVIVPLVGVLATLGGIIWTVNKAVKAYTAVQAALNFVMAMNPIGLVVLAIAALVAGFVLAYKKSETFRNIVNAAFNGIKTVAQTVIRTVVDAFLGFYDTLLSGAAKAFGWVPGIGGKLKTASNEFGKFRDRANAALGGIQDKEITVRIKKVGTGAEELSRIEDEKTSARNSRSGRGGAALVVNNVTNLDGKPIATSSRRVNAGAASRGYLAPGY